MVRFVFGGAGSGKSEYIMNDIARTLTESDGKVILLVPEQQTVGAETKLAKRFDPSLFLRLEATNFTRLADSVARAFGGLSYGRLNDGGRMLVLWRSILSVWPSLSLAENAPAGNETKLIPYIASALREISSAGITPAALLDAADRLESENGGGPSSDSALCVKARDLSLIGEAYSSLLSGEFGELGDSLVRLAGALRESGYLRDTSVYIDSFYSVTGAESLVLGEIIRCAENVTVAIPMRSRNADGVHLLAARRFYVTMLGQALRFGNVEFVTLDGNRRVLSRELCAAEKYLWDYGASADEIESDGLMDLPSVPNSVRIFTVRDRYDEAEAAASVIEGLVRDGARYSDIAVVAADAGKLRGITDSCLRRHGIPVFFSDPVKITSSPAVRLILSVLRIPGRWQRTEIIRAVKTGLLPVGETDECMFEAYTETWNIRGRRMFSSPWNMNPEGYRVGLSDWGREVLEAANRVRECVIPPIERFCDIFERGQASAADICTAIVRLAEDFNIYGAMTRRADALEESGCFDDGARERLVWRQICGCLDTIVDVLGDTRLDPQGFAALFTYVASDVETGAIPTGIDEVIFVSARSLRTDGIRHVIILGAVEGEFPAVPDKDSFFTDVDRERLGEVGLDFGGGAEERASEELFRFYRAVSQASESLTVFIPAASFGDSCPPSHGASRLAEIIGETARPTPFSSLPAEKRIFSREGLIYASVTDASGTEKSILSDMPEAARDIRRTPNTGRDAKIDIKTAEALFGKRLRLSQSRIDKYVKCPFSYYSGYVLSLREEKRAEVSEVDIGSFVHTILEQFFVVTSGEDFPPGREETEKLCDELTGSYVSRICGDSPPDGRLRYLFIRLRRQVSLFLEAVSEEIAEGRFKVYRTEMPIGFDSGRGSDTSPPPVTFSFSDGSEVSLYGIVDRMDVYRRDGETFIRVIDYKTGSTKFSYEDVKLGLNIQLLLYLFAAWRSDGTTFAKELAGEDRILPAGAMYLNLHPGDPASDGPLTAEEARERMLSKITRSGILIDDGDVLDAMGGEKSPVSSRAKNGLGGPVSLVSLERFGELYRELGDVVTGIAERMKQGNAEARPLVRGGRSPCDYCSFGDFCRSRETAR